MTRAALFIAALLACTSSIIAQQAPPPVVAAKVSGQPIMRDDVERQVKAALKERTPSPQTEPILQAQALAVLVDRRLVEGYLERTGEGVATSTIGVAVEKVKADLKTQGTTLDAFLTKSGLSEVAWRRELAWQLSWEKYLSRHITDAELEAYFKAHAREFDGSEVRVSHILLRATDSGSATNALTQAEDLRRRIEAGELTFTEAAKKYSTGPSKQNGGDLGFIPRHGRMDEAFSATAFVLDKGKISPPVVTPFGVHLIQMTDIKAGAKAWTEVRESLQLAVARQLFEKLAAQERPAAKIEFTGAMPYCKPGTQELVPTAK